MGISLIVGVDDTNHAHDNRVKGELVLATFSYAPDDSIVRQFSNRRDYEMAQRWLREGDRDYRFTMLTGDKWRECSQNLVYASPVLIRAFLKENSRLGIDGIKLYLDGSLTSQGKKYLRDSFADFPGPRFVVGNFIKKGKSRGGRTQKRPICPRVVYMADVLAHRIGSDSVENVLKDMKFVPFQTS